MRFKQAIQSHVGLKRKENQDSAGFLKRSDLNLFMVADGMGGAQGGGLASAMAINGFLEIIENFQPEKKLVVDVKYLENVVEILNDVIYEYSVKNPDFAGMGTTLVALTFIENNAYILHIGDSRIYLSRNGDCNQITRDHTLVQELLYSGAISEEEAKDHPISHMLTRSLGPVENVLADVFLFDEEVRPKDRFLLCCDGLYNHVSQNEICEILKQADIEKIAKELLDLALERGGSDNITVVVIEAQDTEANRFQEGAIPETSPEVDEEDKEDDGEYDWNNENTNEDDNNEELDPEDRSKASLGRDIYISSPLPDNVAAIFPKLVSEISMHVFYDDPLTTPPRYISESLQNSSHSNVKSSSSKRFYIFLSLLGLLVGGTFSYFYVLTPSSFDYTDLINTEAPSEKKFIEEGKTKNVELKQILKEAKNLNEPNADKLESPSSTELILPEDEFIDNSSDTLNNENAESEGKEKESSKSDALVIGDYPSKDSTEQEVEAIDWNKEKEGLEFLKTGDKEVETDFEIKIRTTITPELVFSQLKLEEKLNVVDDKHLLREKITDLQNRIRIINLGSEIAAAKEQSKIKLEIASATKLYKEKNVRIERLKKDYQVLVAKKNELSKLAQPDLTALGLKLAKNNPEIKERLNYLEQSSILYIRASEALKNNPKVSQQEIAEVSALGRKRQNALTELNQVIFSELNLNINQISAGLIDEYYLLEYLQMKNDNLTRQLGFLQAYRVSTPKTVLKMTSKFNNRINFLQGKLEEFNKLLSDTEEVSFLKDRIREKYKLP